MSPPARLAAGLFPLSARLFLPTTPGSASCPEKGRACWAWSLGRDGKGKNTLWREERVELKAGHAALSSCGIHSGLEEKGKLSIEKGCVSQHRGSCL